MSKINGILMSSILLIAAASCASVEKYPLGSNPTANLQEEFLNWKFGMFIHFNVATFADREWATGREDPAIFAPEKLDCNQWMDAAASAGMKYAVLTVKHTGGWCLWDSKYTESHDMTAFVNYKGGKGDIVREFVNACREHNIKVGLYYCFPGDFAKRSLLKGEEDKLHGLPPEAQDNYTEFIKKQLTELMSNYGDINLLWIDQYNNKYTRNDWQKIKQHVKSLQPKCLVIANNSINFEETDIHSYEYPWLQGNSPERKLPPKDNSHPAEVCDKMGYSWFWRNGQNKPKSAEDIVSMLELCNSRRANYLLNVAPDTSGLIPEDSVKRLREIGQLLAVKHLESMDALNKPTNVSVKKYLLKADPTALKKWQDMRFGMFIHWGPVSLTGHEIGWSRGKETPIEEYDQLYKKFNPTEFDADKWVQIAKDAGMKYMVLTTKHHDGFCLWPSKYTDYNIANTPFKRDVVKELSEACKKEGIRFGAYYSTCDWWHPGYPKGSPGGKTDKPNPDMDSYIQYLRNQVTELVTNYGPLLTIWFDVPKEVYPEYGKPTVEMLRKLQPDILINNRVYSTPERKRGHGEQDTVGDYSTPEQKIGGFNRERPWETCMTICRQWAWKPNDTMKSLKDCIQALIYTVGGDGNLLFNVGPMPDGRIESRQVERLREMGEWMEKYGDAVYGTRGGPFKPGQWGASTCKDNKFYLFVMNWPEEGPLQIPALSMKITNAEVKSGGTVKMTRAEKMIELDVPKDNQDSIATVIQLTVEGNAVEIEPLDMHGKERVE